MAKQIVPPHRSVEELAAALRGANTIRFYRAQIKAELKKLDRPAFVRAVAAWIFDPPENLHTMKVWRLDPELSRKSFQLV